MAYMLEYLTKALKKAREDKKLSQGALSRRVGMPQTQISRIEQSCVDLRTSTLIELARFIGIDVPETRLVPLQEIAGLFEDVARLEGNALAVKCFDRRENGGLRRE